MRHILRKGLNYKKSPAFKAGRKEGMHSRRAKERGGSYTLKYLDKDIAKKLESAPIRTPTTPKRIRI